MTSEDTDLPEGWISFPSSKQQNVPKTVGGIVQWFKKEIRRKLALLFLPVGKVFSAFGAEGSSEAPGFSVLLKDTLICNYVESGDQTG